VTYREAQQAIEAEVPEKFDARARAYLLLKRHGQDLCKRTNPKCWQCPSVPPALSLLATVAGDRRPHDFARGVISTH
jgi:endonuclease III